MKKLEKKMLRLEIFDTVLIALILLVVLAIYFNPLGITGFITYSPNTISCWYNSSHAAYPNWNITSDCTVSDGEIELIGELKIYGNLTLNNVTIIVNSTPTVLRNITVYSGGLMNITSQSNITSNDTDNRFGFVINSGSTFEMRDSYLSYCGLWDDYGGLWLQADNAIIQNNTFSNNHRALYVEGVSNAIIQNNIIFNSTIQGVYVRSSSNNNITNNTIYNHSGYGISFYLSGSNIVANSTIYNNARGVVIGDSSNNNNITDNVIYSNTIYGIDINSGASNNRIYNNNFSTNTNNARDQGTNYWNTTKQSKTSIINTSYVGGNYFDDYIGTDYDNDNIGDTQIPYNSSLGSNGDYLPLTLNLSAYCKYNASHPDYPNWNIPSFTNCKITDDIIEVEGDVTVFGGLTFDNVTLIMNQTADGQNNITVYSGGLFNITSESNITSNNSNFEFIFNVNSGSTFEMRDSYLSECGFNPTYPGLHIKTNDSIVQNNTIFNSSQDGIVFEGANNSVITDNIIRNTSGFGLVVLSSLNNTLTNNIAYGNNQIGIRIYSSNSTTLTNNTAYENQYGIYLYDSYENIVTNNTAYDNQYGFYVLTAFYNNLTNNTAYNNSDYGIRVLSGSTNNILANNTVYNNSNEGIEIINSNNNTMRNNTAYDCVSGQYGISVSNSNNTVVDQNLVYNCQGMSIDGYYDTITNNTIHTSNYGFDIVVQNSTVSNNTMYNITQYCGIYVVGGNFTNFTNNLVYDNSQNACGFDLYDSHYNTITNNQFNDTGNEGIIVTGNNNTITGNIFSNHSTDGIEIASGSYSDNVITGNTICYNNLGLDNKSTGTNTIDNNIFCNDLSTPANGSSSTSFTNFTFNVSNPLFTTSCQLYIDGTYAGANSSVSNNQLSNISYTSRITAGIHNWFVYCNDSLSTNWANSSLFIFTKQTVCGDGYCEAGELCSTCFADCGSCASVGGGVLPPADEEPEVDPTEQPLEIIPIPEPGTVIDIPSGGVSVSLEPNVFLNLYGATATVHNITKVEGGRYKILVCDQAELVSYEINVTVDLAYFCINYSEYTDVTDLSIFKFEDDWLELGTRNIVIGDQVICGNISSTPYMIAGFSRPATAALALESIQLANQSVSEALERGANAFDSLDLLKKANNAYFNCKYEEATELANKAKETISEVEPEILFFILIGIMLILVGIWYYWSRVRKKVEISEGIKVIKTKK